MNYAYSVRRVQGSFTANVAFLLPAARTDARPLIWAGRRPWLDGLGNGSLGGSGIPMPGYKLAELRAFEGVSTEQDGEMSPKSPADKNAVDL